MGPCSFILVSLGWCTIRSHPGLDSRENPGGTLLADHLNDGSAVPGGFIEIDEDDLLPAAEREFSINHREHDAWPEHGRPDMGVPVPIVPVKVVGIVHILREETFEGIREVLKQSRFVLDAGDSGRCPR